MTPDSRNAPDDGRSRRDMLRAGATLAALAAGAGRSAFAADAKQLKASIFSPPANVAVHLIRKWSEELTAKTGGEVTVTIFPSSQMGPPNRQYDLVRDGIADFSWVLHGFTPGRFPTMDIVNLPGLFDTSTQGTQAIGRVRDRLVAAHTGVRVLGLVASSPLIVMTRDKVVRSLADFQGLRIRPPSAVAAGAIQKLGGASVAVPPAEMGEALAKGVIDAIATTAEAGSSYRLYETVKHITNLNLGVATFAFVMNRDAYGALSKTQKAALDAIAGAPFEQEIVAGFEKTEAAGRDEARAQGVEFVALSKTDAAAFDAILSSYDAEFVANLASKGVAGAKEIYAAMKG